MAGGEERTASLDGVMGLVRSMGSAQLYEAIRFAVEDLAARDMPFENLWRLCDERAPRRAPQGGAKNPPAMGGGSSSSGAGEEVARIKSKLEGGGDGRQSSDPSEEAVLELLRALEDVPMTYETLVESKIGRTILGLEKKHASTEVRRLASALYERWMAIGDEHLIRSCTEPPAPTKAAGSAPAAADDDKAKAAAPKKPASKRKLVAPAPLDPDEAKLAATAGRLKKRYAEAETIKKQRKIQVIDAPAKAMKRPVVTKRRRVLSSPEIYFMKTR